MIENRRCDRSEGTSARAYLTFDLGKDRTVSAGTHARAIGRMVEGVVEWSILASLPAATGRENRSIAARAGDRPSTSTIFLFLKPIANVARC
jgi:hypothetical protein